VDPVVVAFVVLNAVALLFLPRRWAPLPLIVGACYMTRAQTVEVGVASLTVVRLLIPVGFLRILIRGERIRGGVNALDVLMIVWGVWMVGSVAFHANPESPFVLRVRDLYEAWGLYLLFRVFCQTREDIRTLCQILAVVLVPIAVAMLAEKWTGANIFARFGGVPQFSTVRNGVIRAQGPFAHSILAGSIGGVCLPAIFPLWRDRRLTAAIGIAACLAIVFASGSSGPILAAGSGIGVLLLWPIRERMRLVRWTTAAIYIGLELVMNRPAYFIMADVDLMGGSTSWYRVQLIRSTFQHFNEWWLVGTDYTRHWMPSGVPSNPTQTDITNHYIAMGVVGGLLLMVLFICLFIKAFWYVGAAIRSEVDDRNKFYCWAIGASLFAHAMTCLSISYFDASIIFLYLTLAASAATLATESVGQVAAVGVPITPVRPRHVSSWQPVRARAGLAASPQGRKRSLS